MHSTGQDARKYKKFHSFIKKKSRGAADTPPTHFARMRPNEPLDFQTMALYLVMGVSGCGKTTLAQRLAEAVGGSWLDADDFHSPANRAKMAAGIPLTDEDRWPWLETLNAELRRAEAAGETLFLACSALKQVYRDRLARGLPELKIIYLKGSKELIHSRIVQRTGHFMPAALLDSQFALLEEPTKALVLSIDQPIDEMAREFAQTAG